MKNGTRNGTGKDELPIVISVRTQEHVSELRRWRRGNRRVPWAVLLRDALDEFFKKKAA